VSEEGFGGRLREIWEEQRFEDVVLQTHLGEVYSLDLYTTYAPDIMLPDLACSGYYLPPAVQIDGAEVSESTRAAP
jgi:hypothetical protein